MTVVYYLYNAQGTLLYVGATKNLDSRLKSHRTKPWWAEVARVSTQQYSTRKEAWRAEREAIVEFRPKYNRHSKIDRWGNPLSSDIRVLHAVVTHGQEEASSVLNMTPMSIRHRLSRLYREQGITGTRHVIQARAVWHLRRQLEAIDAER